MLHVDLAGPDDTETIVDLFVSIDRHYYGADAATREATAAYVRENLFAPHAGVDLAIAKQDDAAVGIATWAILYPAPRLAGQLFMKDLFVRADARGQGVGRALMQFLAARAIEHGCERFDWTTETSNPEAIAWYDGLGAERVTSKVYYRMTGDDLRRLAGEDEA